MANRKYLSFIFVKNRTCSRKNQETDKGQSCDLFGFRIMVDDSWLNAESADHHGVVCYQVRGQTQKWNAYKPVWVQRGREDGYVFEHTHAHSTREAAQMITRDSDTSDIMLKMMLADKYRLYGARIWSDDFLPEPTHGDVGVR